MCADAESVDDEQAMAEKEGSKPKDRIGYSQVQMLTVWDSLTAPPPMQCIVCFDAGGVDFHVNVCLGLRSGPLHVLVKIGSAVCRIAQ